MRGFGIELVSPRRRTIVLLALGGVLLLSVIAFWRFAAGVAALRALRATGPSWSFPSRIYSDGVPLTRGRVLAADYLIAQLEARGYRETPGRVSSPGVYARIAGGFEIGLRGFPDQPDPAGSGGPERVRVRIESGRLAAVERLGGWAGAVSPDPGQPARLEPALVSMLFDQDRVWRTWVSLARVPQPVRDAVIASEDRRFRRHIGFDLRANLRALATNVRARGVRQGGSTITQQLARGLFLGRERTLLRKVSEIPLALGLELLLSKDQILEMYLNSVYWGQARGFGVGGIAEAARWYFDTPVESLTVLQGATLVAMIPAPNVYDPFSHPGAALERRNRVLHDMVETRALTEPEAAALMKRPLGLARGPLPIEQYPSYCGYAHDRVDDRISRHAASHFGLSIYTTMDLAWQRQAEAGVTSGLDALDGRAGRDPRLEGAFIALDPATSAVLAMVGGRRPGSGDFNRAYQARRQSGSAIKPIVFAAAFESRHGFTPATIVADTTRTFGHGDDAWTPGNFDAGYHGQVTLAKALDKSLNIATTELVERVGPPEVARVAAQFGLGRLKPVLSMGLGSNEVSPLDLTSAFAVFGAGGILHRPSPLRAVVDRTGRVVIGHPPEGARVLPQSVAALMTGLLQNVVRFGVAYPLKHEYGFTRPVAGKTGTTNDYRDAWFIGFTPDVVAGLWVGYDQPRPIGQPAVRTALPMWARILGRMLAGFPARPFDQDSEVEWREIDPWTGELSGANCKAERVPFIPGTAPTVYCTSNALDLLYSSEARDTTAADSTAADSTQIGTAPDSLPAPPEAPPAPDRPH